MATARPIELGDSVVDGLVEVVCSGEGKMSEMMPFEIAAEFLDVVEFRDVFWQPLDRQPMPAPPAQPAMPCWCGSARYRV
jgi:hypothetical protein